MKKLANILVIAVVVMAIFSLNFRFFTTSGSSMEPTYEPGTRLFAHARYRPLKAGQVVFVQYNGVYVMKRVAFVAGDDVTEAGFECYWGSPTVPKGYVFVLGDNPDASFDSRNPKFGLVPVSKVWGLPFDQRPKAGGNG